MKGWAFVYYEGENERPVPQRDLTEALRIHEEMRGAKIVSLAGERMKRKLEQVPIDLKGPMAIVHILSGMSQYKGVRVEAIELLGTA